MLLAVDIGNSYTKFGVFEEDGLIALEHTETRAIVERGLSDVPSILRRRFSHVVICSVVPSAIGPLTQALARLGLPNPTLVNIDSPFGIGIRYSTPETLGLDRLVNASAAAAIYGSPVIVCSFGTATTIDLVNAKLEFVGGTISPGMRLMSSSLRLGTSELPEIETGRPRNVIGDSTEGCIASGIFYGQVALAEGIVSRIASEGNVTKASVIATGGAGFAISNAANMIDIYDPELTLKGLKLIHDRSDNE